MRVKVATAAGLGIALFLLFGWQFLGWFSSEPEAVSIDNALAAASGTSSTTAAPSDAPTTTAAAVRSIDDLSGSWVVEASDATFVGYRIDEVLSGADFEAVGRTKLVTGSLVADGSTISEVEIAADLTGLTSDSRLRDGQMRTQALETNQFPDATFVLTSPISVDGPPVDGEVLGFVASGDLSLHGVTRSVMVPIQASTLEGKLIVVGSLEVALADFEIDKPSAPAVASVSDNATMELSLVFVRG